MACTRTSKQSGRSFGYLDLEAGTFKMDSKTDCSASRTACVVRHSEAVDDRLGRHVWILTPRSERVVAVTPQTSATLLTNDMIDSGLFAILTDFSACTFMVKLKEDEKRSEREREKKSKTGRKQQNIIRTPDIPPSRSPLADERHQRYWRFCQDRKAACHHLLASELPDETW
jgi:hypothetical protein